MFIFQCVRCFLNGVCSAGRDIPPDFSGAGMVLTDKNRACTNEEACGGINMGGRNCGPAQQASIIAD